MCFVRPKNQWLCPAPGLATRLASPCEHEACSISSQVAAAKTVNHFMKLCGLTLTYFCIVQTAAVMLVQASEDKECAHVSVCAQCKGLLSAPCATCTSCLVQRFFRRPFPAVVPHEGYGAGFFVSGVLPASALWCVGRSGRACASEAYKLVLFGQVSSQAFAGVGVRLVAVPGGAAHAGLLEMEMEAGGYGTVCGLNSQAANVACRQIGFEFGVVSPAGCAEYGGASFCGASGSPVAAKAMECAGTEMSLKECKHDTPDDACLSHASDSVVFCGTSATSVFDGELSRLIGASGASSATRSRTVGDVFGSHTSLGAACRQGFTSGSAAVACKTMGFDGSPGFSACSAGNVCGKVPPHVSAV